MKHTKNMIYKPTASSEDLYLYTVNTSQIYHGYTQPVISNLMKKAAKGQYLPDKAVDLWYTVADAAARLYKKELGGQGFSVTDRYTVAVELEARYQEDINN